MKLEELLNERGINKRQFAIAAGVPYTTVYEVISGKRSIGKLTAANAQRIAKTLGMTVEQLLGEEPPALTADETELLGIYRSLPGYAQRMLLGTARQFAESTGDE